MWDTVETTALPLSHDMPCPHCRHATHSYLPCSDDCSCSPPWLGAPGDSSTATLPVRSAPEAA
jgi:hypothetical protein